jgi:hypothetical protein
MNNMDAINKTCVPEAYALLLYVAQDTGEAKRD